MSIAYILTGKVIENTTPSEFNYKINKLIRLTRKNDTVVIEPKTLEKLENRKKKVFLFATI